MLSFRGCDGWWLGSERPMPKPAVLFDIDGTLVDTNYLHTLAWWRAFRDSGHDVPMSTLHHLIGMNSQKLVEEVLGSFDEEVKELHSRYFEELKEEVTAFPRAAELLDTVHRRGATVVLATSGKPHDVEIMLGAVRPADGSIDHITDASDVERSKPEPDTFQAALDAAGLDPGSAMVVGDTVWDVEAAERCGLECVAVLTGGIARQKLEEAGALAVYRDVAELLDNLDDSPLSRLLDGSK